jgi:EAL domain-containing protein (putative c-di-GMP-specific phosphodiesterase class I)
MDLVRDIDASRSKQAIVNGIVAICAALNVRVLVEGIETKAERDLLRDISGNAEYQIGARRDENTYLQYLFP